MFVLRSCICKSAPTWQRRCPNRIWSRNSRRIVPISRSMRDTTRLHAAPSRARRRSLPLDCDDFPRLRERRSSSVEPKSTSRHRSSSCVLSACGRAYDRLGRRSKHRRICMLFSRVIAEFFPRFRQGNASRRGQLVFVWSVPGRRRLNTIVEQHTQGCGVATAD
jgi:hypothetical protein